MPRPGPDKRVEDHALAQKLDLLRRRQGLSTDQVAGALHFSARTIRRYQNGERRPSRETVQAWAVLCGGDVDELLALYDAGDDPPAGIPAGEEAPPRRSLGPWVVALSVVVIVLAAGGAWLASRGDDASGSAHPIRLIVDNRVTNGPTAMDEDHTPVSLSARPRPFCHCALPQTDRGSGDAYDGAVCQIRGVKVTNGNEGDPSDDHNPGLATSTRYYGVRFRDGTFGYVSEVWIRKNQRGGLNLPRCEDQ